jgi:hypothetical protein
VVQAITGTTVLARSRQSTGPVASLEVGLPCQRLSSENVRYTVVPSSLLPLWRKVLEQSGWNWRESSTGAAPDETRFMFVALDGHQVGHGECTENRRCSVVTTQGGFDNQQGGTISLDELLVYAPGNK